MKKIDLLLKKLDKKIETMREDQQNPIGASHAKNKQDAFYNGMKTGLKVAQKCVTGEY